MAAVKDNGHWAFPDQLDFNKAYGFVYAIRRVSTGQIYIGRKNFRTYGKRNEGRQSNWKQYTSSSDRLNSFIKAFGKSDFRFFVLEQYYTVGGVGWAETWSQCHAETATNQVKYLNKSIEKVSWVSKEKITDRHKDRLTKIMNL